MPAKGSCVACSSPHLAVVDRGLAEGRPVRALANETGLSASAITRHARHELPSVRALAMKVPTARAGDPVGALLADLARLHRVVLRGYREAVKARDVRSAATLAQQARLDLALRDRLAAAVAAAQPDEDLDAAATHGRLRDPFWRLLCAMGGPILEDPDTARAARELVDRWRAEGM